MIRFEVSAVPGPQGSKRHLGNGMMIESSKKVKPWRQAVKLAAMQAKTAGFVPFSGPVAMKVTFYLRKPQRPKHPLYPITYPDASKLLRSTEDALTEAGVWLDDALVVEHEVKKRFGEPGASIEIWAI